MGEYDQTPDQMAEEMKFFVDEGWVNIIGGCCGTTDEYIARFRPWRRKDVRMCRPERQRHCV